MSITVSPESFNFVAFDAALTRRVAEELVAMIGLGDHEVRIDVDETTPLARIQVDIDADGAIHVIAQSGAFENTRRPREQSENATATSLGRVLYRTGDRLRGGFADAPPDAQLTLPQVAAWDTYCVGRLVREGVAGNRQRWLYNFRNRHGFSDAADAAFVRLWSGDALTWDELEQISARARGQLAQPTG